jgi:hypothetical protein
MGGCASWRQGKEEDDALPTSLFQKGVNLEKFRLERETGLEPATPCLEGAAPSQRHTITLPFWRKVAPHADHSSSLIITHHHSSSLIITHHRVVIGRVPARQTGMRCGGASHALPRASVTI